MAIGDELRSSLREVRGEMDDAHATRLHRAISWLRCAEDHNETDDDLSFIALWIAFDSCFSVDDSRLDHSFRRDFVAFADKLARLDDERRIHNCLWGNFPAFVRLLIENKYVFAPFWLSVRAEDEEWRRPFEASRRRAIRALENGEVAILLSIIMDRLYVLRNQLVHGGATHRSQVNRDQVRDGKRMLLELVPIFIEIMFNQDEDWGPIYYPVVD